MAIETKITYPGGFESDNGYRRVLNFKVDYGASTVQIDTADYKDEDWRRRHPSSYTAGRSYQIVAQAKAEQKTAYLDDAGEIVKGVVDAAPSFDEFLSKPISTYLPDVVAATTIGELIGAIAYGYARTRTENANATNV